MENTLLAAALLIDRVDTDALRVLTIKLLKCHTAARILYFLSFFIKDLKSVFRQKGNQVQWRPGCRFGKKVI